MHRLNNFLGDTEYGPYDHVSEASRKLQHLQKKKPNKAAQLRQLLQDFAAQEGFRERAFDQWPELLPIKDRRLVAPSVHLEPCPVSKQCRCGHFKQRISYAILLSCCNTRHHHCMLRQARAQQRAVVEPLLSNDSRLLVEAAIVR